MNVIDAIRFTVTRPRDHDALKKQEYIMELIIVTLCVGTLILLATHMIDYTAESILRPVSARYMPEDEAHDVPLPFGHAESHHQAA